MRRPLPGRTERVHVHAVRDDGDLPARLAPPELGEAPPHGDDQIGALHEVGLQLGEEKLADPRDHEARLVVHVLVDQTSDPAQELHEVRDKPGSGSNRDADVEPSTRSKKTVGEK